LNNEAYPSSSHLFNLILFFFGLSDLFHTQDFPMWWVVGVGAGWLGLAWLDLIFLFHGSRSFTLELWLGKRKTWKSALAKLAAPLEFRKTFATFSHFPSCSPRGEIWRVWFALTGY
jgi:hypothetical protein